MKTKKLPQLLVNTHLDSSVYVRVHGCIFCNSICQLFHASIVPSLKATSCPSTFPTPFLTPLFSCSLRNLSGSSFLPGKDPTARLPNTLFYTLKFPVLSFPFTVTVWQKSKTESGQLSVFLAGSFCLRICYYTWKTQANKPFLNSSLPSAYCQEFGLEPSSLGSNSSSAIC